MCPSVRLSLGQTAEGQQERVLLALGMEILPAVRLVLTHTVNAVPPQKSFQNAFLCYVAIMWSRACVSFGSLIKLGKRYYSVSVANEWVLTSKM